jgi:hypothetical protein
MAEVTQSGAQVVGWRVRSGSSKTEAVIDAGTTVRRLDRAIGTSSGWNALRPEYENVCDELAGVGDDNGRPRPFLMIPASDQQRQCGRP